MLHEWKYTCHKCRQPLIEMSRWSPANALLNCIICPGCSGKAVLDKSDGMPTYCDPCIAAGRPDVPAMRFVPVNGRITPMCEKCWGGGIGPGMREERKPAVMKTPPPKTTEVKQLIQNFHERASKAPDEDPVPKKTIGRLEHLAMAAEDTSSDDSRCKCGYMKGHRGPHKHDRLRTRGHVSTTIPTNGKKNSPINNSSLSALDEAIEQLLARRSAIDEAIDAIRSVQQLLQ